MSFIALAFLFIRLYNDREMSQSFQLFRLQQIDTHLDHAKARLNKVEAAMKDDSALRQLREKQEEAQKKMEAAQNTLLRAEENVKAHKIKIERTEAALYGGKIRNPKELQDLQGESEALKRFQRVLDDRLLEAMIAQEEVEGEYNQISLEFAAKNAGMTEVIEQLLKEKGALRQELERLEGERNAAARSVIAAELSLYEQLRKQKRGLAVAVVTDRTCSACGSTLSAAQLHAARSPNQMTRCDVCGRILYGG